MRNTKEMHPGCMYLFEGQSSASSCFIQSKKDAKSFIVLANYYLKDFLKIYEYNLTKDSWVMAVKIRSKAKVLKSYLERREKSSTCNRKNDHTKLWKIISEQMRQFLKHYVTDANKRCGREGSLVRAPYKRSFFENEEEAIKYIESIRKQLYRKQQKLKKYRGRKKFFKISDKKQIGHIYLCSLWKENIKKGSEKLKKFMVDVSGFIDIDSFMPLKLIKRTLFKHSMAI